MGGERKGSLQMSWQRGQRSEGKPENDTEEAKGVGLREGSRNHRYRHEGRNTPSELGYTEVTDEWVVKTCKLLCPEGCVYV